MMALNCPFLFKLLGPLELSDKIFGFRFRRHLLCFRGFGPNEIRGDPILLVLVLVVIKWACSLG